MSTDAGPRLPPHVDDVIINSGLRERGSAVTTAHLLSLHSLDICCRCFFFTYFHQGPPRSMPLLLLLLCCRRRSRLLLRRRSSPSSSSLLSSTQFVDRIASCAILNCVHLASSRRSLTYLGWHIRTTYCSYKNSHNLPIFCNLLCAVEAARWHTNPSNIKLIFMDVMCCDVRRMPQLHVNRA